MSNLLHFIAIPSGGGWFKPTARGTAPLGKNKQMGINRSALKKNPKSEKYTEAEDDDPPE